MKVTAQRIGNSSKERILVDGEVFLKSVKIGQWNYVTRVTYADNSDVHLGKSATRENAHKWLPFRGANATLDLSFNGKKNSYVTPEIIETFKQDHPGWKATKVRAFGCTIRRLTAPYKLQKQVAKVERNY